MCSMGFLSAFEGPLMCPPEGYSWLGFGPSVSDPLSTRQRLLTIHTKALHNEVVHFLKMPAFKKVALYHDKTMHFGFHHVLA